MSAKKELYLAVKERLEGNTSVKHVRLFNSQFDEMDNEDTFPFPCVFVEFATLQYLTKAEGLQEADVVLRFHVGFESLKTEELEILDLLDDIHEDMQGFAKTDLFTPFDRVFEGQDTNHDNVTVWLMDYETLLSDLSGHRKNKLVKMEKIDELCIETDVEKPRL